MWTASGLAALVMLVGGCGRNAPEEGVDSLEGSASPTSTAIVVTTLPPTSITTAPPPTQPEYIIQEGDSLSAIAQRFGVTIAALADFNGIENPDSIKVGQKLTIPPTTVATAEGASEAESEG